MSTKTMKWTARPLVVALALVLCGLPQMAAAQAQSPPPTDTGAPTTPAQNANTDQSQSAQQPAQQPNDRGIIDPSKGPLQPVPPSDTLPQAPSAQQQTTQPPAQQTGQQPLGTAVGQTGQTAGGAASKPAGAAIAPAKQKQYRSLFLKIGAIAAAGAAIGTVVALSKGSPSKPPGAP